MLIKRMAHLDMDAFYASVELLRYPQLKGLPVVIGGGRRKVDKALEQLGQGQTRADIPLEAFARLKDYTGRGVITTATYAARQFGVGSAMGLMKAAKLCPDAILLPVDFDQYRHYSKLFKDTILEFTPLMESRGVDEVYIDFTEVPGGQRQGGRSLAKLIQQTIFERTGLTCSVGVAPNKLLAKMASEFNKPNGIAIVFEEDLQSLIWPLACRKINGVGPKMDEKLIRHGIHTIGELAAKDEAWLIANFGKSTGAWLHSASWGRNDNPISLNSAPVSISRETTFDIDLHAVHDKAELGAVFTKLCEQMATDLQRKGYQGKTIGIKVRYANFKSATRDQTLDIYTDDAVTIRQAAGYCLKRMPLTQKLRLLGVRVGGLIKKPDETMSHPSSKQASSEDDLIAQMGEPAA